MTQQHEITVTGSDSLRWYPSCRCGWSMGSVIRNGEAVLNQGYFGRSTEAEARSIADGHLAAVQSKEEKPMTRLMQGNPGHAPSGHGREHAETIGCSYGIPCKPVVRRMQTNNGRINSYHREEHDEADMCQYRPACVPVADTVAVPVTGTVLVVDGVVQDVTEKDEWENGATRVYRLAVPKPKPTFFEEGKAYTRRVQGWIHQRFEVDRVREGVAFGRLHTSGYGVDWVLWRQHHWDGAGWEETS